ncbi:MAG TPA: hypothetical protein VH951_11970, partial [Dehalococcoidia bacterium]
TVGDLMRQRRRIAAGFAGESGGGAAKATQDWRLRLEAISACARKKPSHLPALASLLALEAAARLSVTFDRLRGRRTPYTAWQPAESTKRPL